MVRVAVGELWMEGMVKGRVEPTVGQVRADRSSRRQNAQAGQRSWRREKDAACGKTQRWKEVGKWTTGRIAWDASCSRLGDERVRYAHRQRLE